MSRTGRSTDIVNNMGDISNDSKIVAEYKYPSSDEEDENQTDPLQGYWMEGDSLAPPCQAAHDVVEAILQLAEVHSKDTVYDLGCGDGRICIQSSRKYNCKSVGCEIEDKLVQKFQLSIERYSLQDLTRCIHDDLQRITLNDATVVTCYLLPDAIELITPMLVQFLSRSGTRLVCNTWGPKNLNPVQRIACGFCNNVTLLLYDIRSIPER